MQQQFIYLRAGHLAVMAAAVMRRQRSRDVAALEALRQVLLAKWIVSLIPRDSNASMANTLKNWVEHVILESDTEDTAGTDLQTCGRQYLQH